jgi:hypothetical protein
MGTLGVFGLLWVAGAVAYLTYALRGSPNRAAVWRSKYGETWPMSRRGHWACALALAMAGVVCLVHDHEQAWDVYAVPAFFGAGGLLLAVRWADRLACDRSGRSAES